MSSSRCVRYVARFASIACTLLLSLAWHVSGSAAQTPKAIGPNECINCHDHESEKTWSGTREQAEVLKLFPDRGKQAGHVNSLNQLDDPQAKKFATAMGLTGPDGPYDANGICVTCHAVDTTATNGVSCESCHGPASGYIELHKSLTDKKPRVADAYEQELKAGMRDLIGKPENWARQCMICHVPAGPKYEKLVAAGHPNGDKFDLGEKFVPVSLHFKKNKDTYKKADMARLWSQLRNPVATPAAARTAEIVTEAVDPRATESRPAAGARKAAPPTPPVASADAGVAAPSKSPVPDEAPPKASTPAAAPASATDQAGVKDAASETSPAIYLVGGVVGLVIIAGIWLVWRKR